MTQFGPTPEVYRQPQDATTARVFSDPPTYSRPPRSRAAPSALATAR